MGGRPSMGGLGRERDQGQPRTNPLQHDGSVRLRHTCLATQVFGVAWRGHLALNGRQMHAVGHHGEEPVATAPPPPVSKVMKNSSPTLHAATFRSNIPKGELKVANPTCPVTEFRTDAPWYANIDRQAFDTNSRSHCDTSSLELGSDASGSKMELGTVCSTQLDVQLRRRRGWACPPLEAHRSAPPFTTGSAWRSPCGHSSAPLLSEGLETCVPSKHPLNFLESPPPPGERSFMV